MAPGIAIASFQPTVALSFFSPETLATFGSSACR